jgi:DNA-binding CsgD family transcriptional regulator
VPRPPRPSTRTNPANLTARELEVLGLLARGMSNAQISHRLVISERTVHHNVSAVIRKLGVDTRHQASVEAVRLGLAGTTTDCSSRPRSDTGGAVGERSPGDDGCASGWRI